MKENTSAINWKRMFFLFSILVYSIFTIQSIFALNYEPHWYDYNQSFRTSFAISPATTDLTDVTLTLTINQSFMGNYYNFSTHRNSTRIYYYNGSEYILAPHYSTTWSTINNNASIQFKAPEILSSSQSRYFIYFGDTNYGSIEDECSTYIYCDHFDDGVLDSQLTTTDQDTVSGTLFSESSGVLSITAGGADTWTGSDEYGSVFMDAIEGDVDVRLSVISSTAPNGWTKTGIMTREDMTGATSSTGYSFTVRTPSNGYSFQRDENNNGYLESHSGAGSPSTLPSHVRLVKSGTTHTGYYSKTDQNSWNQINSRTITSTNAIQDIGISVTSHAGATTATATFDNFSIRRYHTDTFSFSNVTSEKLFNFLNASINSPSTTTTQLIQQNSSLMINTTVSCNSFSGDSCYNVTGFIQYNDSPTTFTTIQNFSTTPMWTNLTSISCILNDSQSCNMVFTINLTGAKNTYHKLRVLFSSNDSNIENFTTNNFSSRIVVGNAVGFNVSMFDFGNVTKHFGDKPRSFEVISNYGDNTNINVECESGDCGEFSDSFMDGISLLEGNSNSFTLSCLDNSVGLHSARFNVTSDEFEFASYLDLTCRVTPLYGPLSTIINIPISNREVGQNTTFRVNTTASCTGICGDVKGYLKYVIPDWFDNSFAYRQKINISSTINTQKNYQVLLRLNSTTIGNNFNWSNNCEDVIFVHNSSELNYWTQNCSSLGQLFDVWVKTNSNVTNSQEYEIEMYYGNPSATSKSNASATFRKDEIFLITGNCPSSNSFCNMMDNHADSDGIKSNIGLGSFTIYGQDYVTQISHPSNPFGSDDDYYSRYRFLFIPKTSGTYWFGTASDDGSDAGIFPFDGYGGGIRTNHPYGAHDVVTDWYGGHGSGTCGSSAAVERSRALTKDNGYWVDYTQQERGGGQDSQMCIRSGSSGPYSIVNSANFQGEIFAREYVTPEPTVSSVSLEESLYVSISAGDAPMFTLNSQPQSCLIPEGGSCSYEWIVNATGPINSSYSIEAYFKSNYSQVTSNTTIAREITITDSIFPSINVSFPLNNQKFLMEDTINFIWQISDDDLVTRADLYLNNAFNRTINCSSNVACNLNLSLPRGMYSWFISATDSQNHTSNSSLRNFTVLKSHHSSISKSISSITTDFYQVNLTVENKLNDSQDIVPIDVVNNQFNYGSFTMLYDWLNLTNGIYHGKILGWDLTNPPLSITYINYSITKNTPKYHLLDEFVVGLD